MIKPTIIAELCCNHKGEMEVAKEMIQVAKQYCNVDIVKFQKRDNNHWAAMKPEQYNSPHPNAGNAYGRTYLEHREALEFSKDQHRELMEYCNDLGVEYSTSTWDLPSAIEIADLNPKFIKIPSACNNDFEMLEYLCDNFQGDIHISAGMSTKAEIQNVVDLFVQRNRNKDLVLYSCTSGYPVPFEDICLLEISDLKDKYEKVIKAIGFSGHHKGIAVDVAAYTLGAVYIERHFTLDRTWKGTDHAASLEPDGLRRMVRDLNAVQKALTFKSQEILPIEQVQRDKLKNL